MKVNMHEAKSQLSALGEKAWAGEQIIIAKAGKPYLILSPYTHKRQQRIPGGYENQIKTADDFDEVSMEIIDIFEGKEWSPCCWTLTYFCGGDKTIPVWMSLPEHSSPMQTLLFTSARRPHGK